MGNFKQSGLPVLILCLTPFAVGEINSFDRSEEWRLVGDAELTGEGLKLSSGSQAIADYQDFKPENISLSIKPGKGDHRIAFKGNFRPVITVSCSTDSLEVNGEEIEKPGEKCKGEINLDWEKYKITSIKINGEKKSKNIAFQNKKDSLDRTRVHQPSGTEEAIYKYTTTGEKINKQNKKQKEQEKGIIDFLISLIPI